MDQPNPFDLADVAAAESAARLERLHRYKSAHQRTFDRALKEIRDLQSIRAALEQIEPKLPMSEALADALADDVSAEARRAQVEALADVVRRTKSAPLARVPILLKAIKSAAKGWKPGTASVRSRMVS
jgi:hypothetical protein